MKAILPVPISSPDLSPLPAALVERLVADALSEDLGLAGDITSAATVPRDQPARAVIAARAPGVVAGLDLAEVAFRSFDSRMRFAPLTRDGKGVERGVRIAEIEGPARALLGAERVGLNFLCHMSGIASLTGKYVDAISGTGAAIIDTRKTTPGLRVIEKYAVRAGGGHNHRFGLFDAVLIKDNHIVAAGGISRAVQAARSRSGHMVRIEVEIDRIDQIDEALGAGADIIMLDNMDPDMLREAVRHIGGRAVTEASGGVTLDSVRTIAETGVDLISVGALTHSAPALDFGLDFL